LDVLGTARGPGRPFGKKGDHRFKESHSPASVVCLGWSAKLKKKDAASTMEG